MLKRVAVLSTTPDQQRRFPVLLDGQMNTATVEDIIRWANDGVDIVDQTKERSMKWQPGIAAIQIESYQTRGEPPYVTTKVVFGYDSQDPNKGEVFFTEGEHRYVVTSIEHQDNGYLVRGRLIQKNGKKFRHNYSQHLGYLRLGLFGGAL